MSDFLGVAGWVLAWLWTATVAIGAYVCLWLWALDNWGDSHSIATVAFALFHIMSAAITGFWAWSRS